jgi:hypothetical protein
MAGRMRSALRRTICAASAVVLVTAGGSLTAVGLAGGVAAAAPAAVTAVAGYQGPWTPTYNQDFPDPTVMVYNNTLYAYSTETVAAQIPGAQSTDAVNWQTVSTDIFPNLPSFAGGGMTWAPSVEQAADGQFVMYYTALNPILAEQCIGEATSSSPAGPFVDSNAGFVVCQTPIGGSIDPQIFQYPGGAELLWKSDGNSIHQPTHIWTEPLDANFQLTGAAPTMLLTDDESFQSGIVEGPNMVDVNGTFDLFYGAAGFNTANYSVGYATCAGPVGPCTDHATPLLVTAGGESGPGGPAFFSYNGRMLMAFAAWPGVVGYNSGGYRAMYVASVSFDPQGTPSFTPYNFTPSGPGYALASADGSVFSYGSVPYQGSLGAETLNAPAVGIADTADGQGYWMVTSDGGVFGYGDAGFDGSMGGIPLNQPIVGMASTPDGGGYWMVAADGGIFAFGDATFYGSTGNIQLNSPVVGMASTADGKGYWLVAADGGIFSFGDAPFLGSMGAVPLNQPVAGMAATSDGQGYWMVARDGGIFTFGDAIFDGSMGGSPLNQPIVGMAATSGGGYWMVARDGGIFTFGDAAYLGSMGGVKLKQPVVGIAGVS